MSATAEDKKPPEKPTKPAVTVTYNGVDSDVDYNPKSSMQALLDHSMNAFNVTENRHLMALFTTEGIELPVTGSVEDAGVQPGHLLILRPSAVRGG